MKLFLKDFFIKYELKDIKTTLMWQVRNLCSLIAAFA